MHGHFGHRCTRMFAGRETPGESSSSSTGAGGPQKRHRSGHVPSGLRSCPRATLAGSAELGHRTQRPPRRIQLITVGCTKDLDSVGADASRHLFGGGGHSLLSGSTGWSSRAPSPRQTSIDTRRALGRKAQRMSPAASYFRPGRRFPVGRFSVCFGCPGCTASRITVPDRLRCPDPSGVESRKYQTRPPDVTSICQRT